MILGPYGGLVWFQPAPKNGSITDFRVQTYRSQRVLTWWQGNVMAASGKGSMRSTTTPTVGRGR